LQQPQQHILQQPQQPISQQSQQPISQQPQQHILQQPQQHTLQQPPTVQNIYGKETVFRPKLQSVRKFVRRPRQHATSIVRGSGPLKIEDGTEEANSSADANLQSRTASHQKVNCLHKVFFYNEKCCF
jgi:hypothetical protein